MNKQLCAWCDDDATHYVNYLSNGVRYFDCACGRHVENLCQHHKGENVERIDVPIVAMRKQRKLALVSN